MRALSLAAMGGATKFLTLISTHFPRLHHSSSSFRPLSRTVLPQSLLCSRYFLNSSPSSKILVFLPQSPRRLLCTQSDFIEEAFSDPNGPSHPQISPQTWPEWSKLMEALCSWGYFNQAKSYAMLEDEFALVGDLPEDFLQAAHSCLMFANQRPNLLGYLSPKDIEVLVENGSPFLFRKCTDSIRRMKSFLGLPGKLVSESDIAHTIDLMRFLLSYINNPNILSESSVESSRKLTESSVRNLLNGIAQVIHDPAPDAQSGHEIRFPRKDIEMKRGDWICPRCNFMNFAKNMWCIDCKKVPRPPRQLNDGEWLCPQCDFHNYSLNKACLRCNRMRPEDVSFKARGSDEVPPRPGTGLRSDSGPLPNVGDKEKRVNTDNDFPEIMPTRIGVNRYVVSTKKTPLERRVADNGEAFNKKLDPVILRQLDEIIGPGDNACDSAYGTGNMPEKLDESKTVESEKEVGRSLDMSEEAKTERWFKRVAQIKDISELSEIPDEDFPSIMPMRKGVNRYVVSKRKTPLERRMQAGGAQRRDVVGPMGEGVKIEDEG